MRVALTLAYDGRTFNGWQTQPEGAAVQDAVETAIAAIAGERVRVVCAGRTDAGVHALAQVVHFDAPRARPLSAWTRGVNSQLPDHVAVTSARAVRADFHARFDATGRQYQYLLRLVANRDALWAGRAGWFHRPLDIVAMRAAADCLAGTHDFSAFRSSQCQAISPIRTLEAIEFSGSPELLLITVTGNAFLHHMIRNIVGALVDIGAGRHNTGWMAQLLTSRDRRLGAPTFSAAGLYFCGACYPVPDNMPGFVRVDSPALSPGLAASIRADEGQS